MENKKTFKSKKPAIQVAVNLVLSIVAIYVSEIWTRKVLSLSPMQAGFNILAVVSVFSMFLVDRTFYNKGLGNNAKKFFLMAGLSVAAIGSMILSSTTIDDIYYPLTGFMLAAIVFYMISLSTVTINLSGMFGVFMFLMIPVVFMKYYGKIDYDTVGTLVRITAVGVLFVGGTWSDLKAFIFGIKGVTSIGGGSGNTGDHHDGDPDTEYE